MYCDFIDEKKAFADLKKIMRLWDINDNSQRLMDLFFEQLVRSKWDRHRIYNFAFVYIKDNLSDTDYDDIPEAAFDYLADIESSIIGYCSYDSFLKIPDEPHNKNELIAYVRGQKWKN
ncbi:hypothetical protein [Gilliamella sp. Pas-s25]|uniref:hypothetical protein n=1 Tax=Gilliamella sp. Pas-s25 TaxID=2687310 RepID=UPI0013659F92|nr:hypothetical protein [Gilliamella sp. Pas-s25]